MRNPAPTPHDLRVLAACLRLGQKGAAHELGMSVQNVKNTCSLLYAKLEVCSATEAAIALGWLSLPGETEVRVVTGSYAQLRFSGESVTPHARDRPGPHSRVIHIPLGLVEMAQPPRHANHRPRAWR